VTGGSWVDSLDVFTPSRRHEVDLMAVEGCVQARCAQYGHAPAIFDPAQGFQMMARLRAAGLRVLEHTFSAQSNSRRALLILELVRGRRLWLPDDPETVAEFAAVRLRETSPGVYRYDHDSGKHDDRVTAISLGALHLLERPMGSPAAPIFGATPERSKNDLDGTYAGPAPVIRSVAVAVVEPFEDEEPPQHYVEAYASVELAKSAWNVHRRRERQRAARESAVPSFVIPARPSRWTVS
jgi:hypothetical protein